MANRVAESLGVAVSYVVSNSSSYAWPDATRALPVNDAAPDNALQGWKSTEPHTSFTYGPFDGAKDIKYNLWPYGLEQRTGGYMANMTDEQLKKPLAARPTVYLLSQVDTLPLEASTARPRQWPRALRGAPVARHS
jgi:hypothetical protein